MQFAQRPGGAYALKVNPHFPQTGISAIEPLVASWSCSLQGFPKAIHRKMLQTLFEDQLLQAVSTIVCASNHSESGKPGRAPTPGGQFLTADDGDQVTQFIIHVLRIGDGVGNSLPQEFTITMAKAMDSHPRGALTQAQLRGQFRIRDR